MNRRSFLNRIALWFATLPVIRLYWTRPKVVQAPLLVAPKAAETQSEISEYMQQVIDEAFADALANNRAAWYKPPIRGDFSGAFQGYGVDHA